MDPFASEAVTPPAVTPPALRGEAGGAKGGILRKLRRADSAPVNPAPEKELPELVDETTVTDTCTMFWFLVADKVRESGDVRLLKMQDLLRERPDWLERRPVSPLDACTRRLIGDHVAVSHRWEDDQEPDAEGAQMVAIKSFLLQRPRVKYLWVDYSCMPQHPRTPPEQRAFDALLPNVK